MSLTETNEHPEQLLLDGKIDALISPNVPPSFRAGDPRIKRLFTRCRETVEDYFAKTRIFPITHTVVVREDLLVKEPWIAKRVADAFRDADRICRKEYNYPKRLSFPTSVLVLERDELAFGVDARVSPRVLQEHQGEESNRLGLSRHELSERPGQVNRLRAQTLALRLGTRRGRVALVE